MNSIGHSWSFSPADAGAFGRSKDTRMTNASISSSVQQLSDTFFNWLPRLAGAIVILLIAWIIAKVVRKAITKVLGKVDAPFKKQAAKAKPPQAAGMLQKVSLSGILGAVAYYVILFTGVSLALNNLKIPRLDDAVAALWGYVPNILGALLILIVATLVSGAIAGGVARLMGDTVIGKLVASIEPLLIMTIAVFMALVQLQLGVQIVTLTYALVLGGICLGAALAFGLGGRNAAQQMLDGAYQKGQTAIPQAKEEIAVAKQRATELKDEAQAKVRESENVGSEDPESVTDWKPSNS